MVRSLLISFMAVGLLVLLISGAGAQAAGTAHDGIGIFTDARPNPVGPALRPPEMAPPRPFVYPPSAIPDHRDKGLPKPQKRSDLRAVFTVQ
jgi:hypothetical protein